MDYLVIYLELFELEILSWGLTQVFTLTNKNRRRTELNENKISYWIGEKEESALKTIFFITQLYLQSIFLSLISLISYFYIILLLYL
jgi:hypothetical protein